MTHEDLIVLLSTVLFFALLHQFPVDGRRWESSSRRDAHEPDQALSPPVADTTQQV